MRSIFVARIAVAYRKHSGLEQRVYNSETPFPAPAAPLDQVSILFSNVSAIFDGCLRRRFVT